MVSYLLTTVLCLPHRCLNPYCSGRWSRTLVCKRYMTTCQRSLNPYCSGRWSRTDYKFTKLSYLCKVLILIVVEDGLVPYTHCCKDVSSSVLILIVVEDGLVRTSFVLSDLYKCLNPYCSGRWSRTNGVHCPSIRVGLS